MISVRLSRRLVGHLSLCLKKAGENLNAAFVSVSEMINECHKGLNIVYMHVAILMSVSKHGV